MKINPIHMKKYNQNNIEKIQHICWYHITQLQDLQSG